MPLYDFVCSECGNQIDDHMCPRDELTIKCPLCNEDMDRQMPSTSFTLTPGAIIKHKRKYGNNHQAVPRSPDNGVKFGAQKRSKK